MGLLKGKTGFLARAQGSLAELRRLGETTTRAGLSTLEQLTRTGVETDAAQVALLPADRLPALLGRHEGSEVAARFPFSGTTAGMAALFLPKQDAIGLVELLLGREKGSVKRFGALEESTIAETANIALNGCLNALSREEGVRFRPEVPEVAHRVKDLAGFLRAPGGDGHVVVVETPYREASRGVAGTFVLVFALE